MLVEFVIVSISPVPKLEPGPVSYFQLAALTPEPAAPAKLSLNTVEKPVGGAGTVVAAAGCDKTTAANVEPPNAAANAAAPAMNLRRRGIDSWGVAVIGVEPPASISNGSGVAAADLETAIYKP